MSERPISRIAFGACNDQDAKNNLWPIIESRQPAAFVWGGDAIYADIHIAADWTTLPPQQSRTICATPARLYELYRRQNAIPEYRRLVESNVTIFGTFDDHDYGCNNADRTYEFRHESAVAYVDFLNLPHHSAMSRRARAGQGVFGVKLFDFARSEGQIEVDEYEAAIDPDATPSGWDLPPPLLPAYSNHSVAVFVLDVRSNKTPWKQGAAAYHPDYEGDFLGERQWQWLERAIRRSRAAVNVIVNGLQVHANIFPDGNIAEAWGKYPRAQQRLFDALLQDGVEAPILISGDVHMTQMMRKDCVPRDDYQAWPRPLFEMTTSGMTHSWGTLSSPPLNDPDRQVSLWQRGESLLASTMMHVLHFSCPWTDLIHSEYSTDGRTLQHGGEGAKKGLQYSLLKNFGELEFDWDDRMVVMRTWGEDSSRPLLMTKVSMDQLSGRSLIPSNHLSSEDFRSESRMKPNLHESEWICINHRGRENNVSHLLGHIATGFVLTFLIPAPFFLPSLIILVMVRKASSRRHTRQAY